MMSKTTRFWSALYVCLPLNNYVFVTVQFINMFAMIHTMGLTERHSRLLTIYASAIRNRLHPIQLSILNCQTSSEQLTFNN